MVGAEVDLTSAHSGKQKKKKKAMLLEKRAPARNSKYGKKKTHENGKTKRRAPGICYELTGFQDLHRRWGRGGGGSGRC